MKRYDIVERSYEDGDLIVDVVMDENGQFVDYDDYDRLQKDRDELKEINRKVLKELTRTTRWLEANFEPTNQFLRNIHVIEKATGKTWAELQEPEILPVEKIRGILGGSGKEAGE